MAQEAAGQCPRVFFHTQRPFDLNKLFYSSVLHQQEQQEEWVEMKEEEKNIFIEMHRDIEMSRRLDRQKMRAEEL